MFTEFQEYQYLVKTYDPYFMKFINNLERFDLFWNLDLYSNIN